MGETTDDLRRQVDQKRDDASEKIERIENQVMNKAQDIETKVSDKAQEVKAQLDWRHQVEERPLLAVGAALVGGMLLGGMIGRDGQHSQQGSIQQSGATYVGHEGGVTNAVRKAARQSGLEDSIQNFANSAFGMLGERMREMTDRTFPGMLDKVQHAADTVANAGKDQDTPPYADANRSSSTFAG